MKKLFKNYRRFTAITFTVLFTLGLVMIAFLQNYTPAALGGSDSFIDSFFGSFMSKPTNILLLGGDASSGCTDTMMVINVNPNTSELSMLSIPRDTKVTLGTWTGKINAVYTGHGANAIMDTVGNLLGIKIENYAHIDLAVFRRVIDSLGGVRFNVPVDLYYKDSAQKLFINLKKGDQLLDGDKAEQLMRFREWGGDPGSPKKPPELDEFYNGGDLTRINMQQKFIKEVINQKLVLSNITKLGEIVSAVFENLKTDLELNDILRPSGNFISKFNSENIHSYKLNGTDGPEYPNGPWYFYYGNTVFETTSDGNKIVEAQGTLIVLEEHFKCDNWYSGSTGNIKTTKGTKSTTKVTTKPTNNTSIKNSPVPTNSVTLTKKPDVSIQTNQPKATIPPTTIKPTESAIPTPTGNVTQKPTASPNPVVTQKPNNQTNSD